MGDWTFSSAETLRWWAVLHGPLRIALHWHIWDWLATQLQHFLVISREHLQISYLIHSGFHSFSRQISLVHDLHDNSTDKPANERPWTAHCCQNLVQNLHFLLFLSQRIMTPLYLLLRKPRWLCYKWGSESPLWVFKDLSSMATEGTLGEAYEIRSSPLPSPREGGPVRHIGGSHTGGVSREQAQPSRWRVHSGAPWVHAFTGATGAYTSRRRERISLLCSKVTRWVREGQRGILWQGPALLLQCIRSPGEDAHNLFEDVEAPGK